MTHLKNLMEHVSKLYEKHPENKGYEPFLRQGIYGLRDLVIAVRRLVAYHS